MKKSHNDAFGALGFLLIIMMVLALFGPKGIIIPLAWIWFALLVLCVVGVIVDERRNSIERDHE